MPSISPKHDQEVVVIVIIIEVTHNIDPTPNH